MSAEYGSGLPRVEWRTGYKDPHRFMLEDDVRALMQEALAHEVSDVLIQAGYPVCAEINGAVYALTHRSLDDSEARELLIKIVNRDTAWTDIISGRPVNSQYEVFDPEKKDRRGSRVRYRFRVNASPISYHGGVTACQIVMRAIPKEPPSYQDIGLDEDVLKMACPEDGLVYIAGRTGTGKTTTFASLIRYILENDTPIKGNFITHEEPIEYSFQDIVSNHSIIVQSQIPEHFADFYAANREAMRRKPGGMMIGEMRDEKTIRAAIEASQTGHPVFGTVHATTVAAIPRRLISRFPEAERSTAIFDIIDSARFFMAQTLVPGTNGKRVAVREWLSLDEEARDLLLGLSDMGRVTQAVRQLVIERGWSFTKDAQSLLSKGLITEETAIRIGKIGN